MVVVVWTGVQSPRWVPVCSTGVKEATVAWRDRYTKKYKVSAFISITTRSWWRSGSSLLHVTCFTDTTGCCVGTDGRVGRTKEESLRRLGLSSLYTWLLLPWRYCLDIPRRLTLATCLILQQNTGQKRFKEGRVCFLLKSWSQVHLHSEHMQ